jgi:hypothetical protein
MHQISLTVYRLRVVVHGITLTMIVVQLAIQAMVVVMSPVGVITLHHLRLRRSIGKW